MTITYINQDGHTANAEEAIATLIQALQSSINNANQIGEIDLFGDAITVESAAAALKSNLHDIGRALMRLSESIKSE